jgi:acyl-CoA hydrolase
MKNTEYLSDEIEMTLLNTHPIKKSDLGFHGNLFGGKLLAWLDASAAAYAMQVCYTPRMVTVKIDDCVFSRPAKEGQLIKIYAGVKSVGNTSITIYMEARSHNVYSGKQNTILSTNIKFVRIDEMGDPVPVSDHVKQRYTNVIEPNENSNQ